MTLQKIINEIIELLLKFIVPIIFGLTLVVFLWGLVGYIKSAGDEKKRGESVQYMIYGIVGLFVMISVWGLVSILAGTFGFEAAIPQFRTGN